jgi:hypothetical protein
MDKNRKTAISVGALYITATVAGVLSVVFSGSILEKPLNFINIAVSENQLISAAFLELIMAVAVAGIAFMLYPILKQTTDTESKAGLALWYVGTRLTESTLFFVGILGQLSLLKLSREFAKAIALDASYFQTGSAVLLATSDYA